MKQEGAGQDASGSGIDRETPKRILAAAIELFAAHGFDHVSVRDIAEAAGGNHAAIGYYFGGKEELIREAIRRVIAPLNTRRLAALAATNARAGKRRVGLEEVVRAMVEPTVTACMSKKGVERHYARMLVLAFSLRQPFIDEVMSQETDVVAEKFVDALGSASPGSPRSTLYWRYDFMIGATIHILLDSSRGGRLKGLSRGACDTSSASAVTAELVAFIVAGFRGR